MKKIKVGILHSLSGTMASSEMQLVDAALFAIDEINKKGGILGRQLLGVVEDGCSDPGIFKLKAKKLLEQDAVNVVSGCWTSSSRKALQDIIRDKKVFLLYPVQYEGLEENPNILYSGSCLNQQISPAVEWCLAQGYVNFYLVGSDYVFPRTANALIKSLLLDRGAKILGEDYLPLGATDFKDIAKSIKSAKPDFVLNTINGKSNAGFFTHYNKYGNKFPVMSFSISEHDLHNLGIQKAAHYLCWSYFQNLDNKENQRFLSEFGKFNKINPIASDPVIMTYSQIRLWSQAVEKAGTLDIDAVREHLHGQKLKSPAGLLEVMPNNHILKSTFIAKQISNKKFEVIWKSNKRIKPEPWLGMENVKLPSAKLVLDALTQYPNLINLNTSLQTANLELEKTKREIEKHQEHLEKLIEERTVELKREVTQHKDAEEALRDSEENLRTILNSIGDAVISTNVEGKLIHINPVAEKLTGWKEKDALNKPLEKIFNIINEETGEKVNNPVKRVLSEGVVIGLANHTLLISKQGKRIPIADSGAPLRNEDGEITGVVLVFRDQTKEREAQKKLKESEQWNKEIFEGSLDAIFIVDSNTRIADVNKAASSLTGYTKDELLKMSIPDLHEKRNLEAYNKLLKRIIGGESVTTEVRICKKDGTIVETEVSNKQFIIDGIPYMHMVVRDISKTRQAEKTLRESYNIINRSPAVVFLWKNEKGWPVEYVSVNVKNLFGYTAEEFLSGKVPYAGVVQQDDLKKAMKQAAIYKKDKKRNEYTQEYRIITKDGKIKWVEDRTFIRRNEEGDITHYQGIVFDVTERKKAEEGVLRLSRIFEGSLNEIYLFKSDTLKFIQANKAAQNNLGYTMEELRELTALDLKPEFTRESFTKLVEPLRKGEKEKIVFETVHKRKDQSLYDVEVHLQLMEYEHEKLFAAIILDITERKQAEFKIRESRQRLTSHLDNTPLGGIFWDTDLKVTDWNKSAERIFGYSKEEALGKYANELIVPENTQDKVDDVFNQLLSQTGGKKSTNKNITKNGKRIICDWYNVAITDINGKVTGIASLVDDITERKKIEKELKTTIEFNESLIETIPFGLDIVDLEGNVLFMNNLLKDAVGIENPKGKCWEFYKDNGKQCTECPLRDEMKLGETNICEVHNVLGGREYEVTHTVMNFKNQKALLEIFRDVTESKKAQKEIVKLSRCVEQSPAMIVITDTGGDIEFVNPKVTEVTGYSKEELIGKNPKIFQSGKTPKSTYEELWDTILKGETWEGEILNKRKNGKEYWESVSISPILDDKGETINYIGIKEDITEEIKSRNAIIDAKEKAEETNRIKSNFLANMSHELRTPMVGIIGFTEILEEEIDKPELKEYASFIHEASSRLMETLNLILNLTKIEADKINVELSIIDVVRNTKNTVSIFDKTAAKKNIYLKFESSVEKLEMETDERMFDQIISNLVNNAVKYTDKGGVTVSVNKVKNDSYIEIKVKDTGIGIPKDKQKVIWEEFRQVSEGTTRVYEGTGLGLTITNNFVNQLGGEIKLESEPDKGSTFTVLLPIREKTIEGKTAEPALAATTATTETTETKEIKEELKTLLFVEDDKIALKVIPLFLKGHYNVECAKNGEEGVEKAKSKKYDGILMDIHLQTKMDGVQTAKKIKEMEEYKDVPIIAVTAYAMVGDREKYLEAGFTDYISKPFSKNDIIELVDKTIKEET